MKSLFWVAALSMGLGVRSDPVKVNQFMSYDASSKTVTLTVVSAFNSNLGGFNFNGGSNGNQTITIPLGWQVNTGVTTIVPGAGVTINSVGGLIMAEWVTVSLRYRGSSTWPLTGATT